MIKGSLQQEQIMIINVYTSNARSNAMWNIYWQSYREIWTPNTILGDLNTPTNINGEIDKTETQQGTNTSHPSNRNKWTQLITNHRTFILTTLSITFFKICTWNFLQQWSHDRSQNMPQHIFKKSEWSHASPHTTTEWNWRPASQNTPETIQTLESWTTC